MKTSERILICGTDVTVLTCGQRLASLDRFMDQHAMKAPEEMAQLHKAFCAYAPHERKRAC